MLLPSFQEFVNIWCAAGGSGELESAEELAGVVAGGPTRRRKALLLLLGSAVCGGAGVGWVSEYQEEEVASGADR
jgi:hypothetical protein